jgi:hypothetical protein
VRNSALEIPATSEAFDWEINPISYHFTAGQFYENIYIAHVYLSTNYNRGFKAGRTLTCVSWLAEDPAPVSSNQN